MNNGSERSRQRLEAADGIKCRRKTASWQFIVAVLAFGTLLLPAVFDFPAGVERVVRPLGLILALVGTLIIVFAPTSR